MILCFFFFFLLSISTSWSIRLKMLGPYQDTVTLQRCGPPRPESSGADDRSTSCGARAAVCAAKKKIKVDNNNGGVNDTFEEAHTFKFRNHFSWHTPLPQAISYDVHRGGYFGNHIYNPRSPSSSTSIRAVCFCAALLRPNMRPAMRSYSFTQRCVGFNPKNVQKLSRWSLLRTTWHNT